MKPLIKYLALASCFLAYISTQAFNPNLPKGIIYQISLNGYDLQKSQDVIVEYHYLTHLIKGSTSTYIFGKYQSFAEIDSVKTLLENMGCNSPSIIAYQDQMEISVAQAISVQYKADMLTAASTQARTGTKKISVKEVNYLLDVQKSGLKHYYALAIPIKSAETVDKLLEQIDNEQVIEISADADTYSIGRFENFEEVVTARKNFIDAHINDVFIMAQITDERLEIDDTQNFAITLQNLVNDLAEK